MGQLPMTFVVLTLAEQLCSVFTVPDSRQVVPFQAVVVLIWCKWCSKLLHYFKFNYLELIIRLITNGEDLFSLIFKKKLANSKMVAPLSSH
jgi:hypothetical protein